MLEVTFHMPFAIATINALEDEILGGLLFKLFGTDSLEKVVLDKHSVVVPLHWTMKACMALYSSLSFLITKRGNCFEEKENKWMLSKFVDMNRFLFPEYRDALERILDVSYVGEVVTAVGVYRNEDWNKYFADKKITDELLLNVIGETETHYILGENSFRVYASKMQYTNTQSDAVLGCISNEQQVKTDFG